MENKIIGPFIIDEVLNRPLYLQLLEENLTATNIAALENDDAKYGPVFQKDGATPQFIFL